MYDWTFDERRPLFCDITVTQQAGFVPHRVWNRGPEWGGAGSRSQRKIKRVEMNHREGIFFVVVYLRKPSGRKKKNNSLPSAS